MSKCIFHMGYAKCGSTLLQEKVFPTVEGADLRLTPTGDFFEGMGSAPVRRRLVSQIFTCSPDVWDNEEIVRGLFPSDAARDLLISEEALYTTDPSNAHIAAHVAAMARTARRLGYERFELLAIHRRQDERIASAYAQNSRHLDKAGQEDFEADCRRLIDPARDLYRRSQRFDYAGLASLLIDALGRQDVTFIPLELLATDARRFAADLGAVLEQDIDHETLVDRSVNAKQAGAGRWKISPRKYEQRASVYNRLRGRLARRRRPTSFTLSETLAGEVRAAFEPGNRRLAGIFGYPLGELGYF
ncbi:hypothetical protein [Sphingobium sp. SYK-6]|uniref:hypothetical protein n=1 Tax=Sphingobium sp. (strain NBRC 103272 / SYK-6) TaxID=627192 RepID=UPI0002EDB1B8|nr:hypothetical protein [Sphingobium sp. SYK-6]